LEAAGEESNGGYKANCKDELSKHKNNGVLLADETDKHYNVDQWEEVEGAGK
jgi:hypothetical protein